VNAQNQQTPFQDALFVIALVSGGAGLGSFIIGLKNVPVLSYWLFLIAKFIYDHVPQLAILHIKNGPLIVSSAAVAFFIFCVLLSVAQPLAQLMSLAGMDRAETQIKRLSKRREQIRLAKRDKTKHIV
jgi:hypothetical protein